MLKSPLISCINTPEEVAHKFDGDMRLVARYLLLQTLVAMPCWLHTAIASTEWLWMEYMTMFRDYRDVVSHELSHCMNNRLCAIMCVSLRDEIVNHISSTGNVAPLVQLHSVDSGVIDLTVDGAEWLCHGLAATNRDPSRFWHYERSAPANGIVSERAFGQSIEDCVRLLENNWPLDETSPFSYMNDLSLRAEMDKVTYHPVHLWRDYWWRTPTPGFYGIRTYTPNNHAE